jgi:hypothetical protein
MPAGVTPSVAAVEGENKLNKGTRKKKTNSRNTNNYYSLKEMTVLVEQVIKIEPEYLKNGWKIVAAAVDREMRTNNPRSPTALQKKI